MIKNRKRRAPMSIRLSRKESLKFERIGEQLFIGHMADCLHVVGIPGSRRGYLGATVVNDGGKLGRILLGGSPTFNMFLPALRAFLSPPHIIQDVKWRERDEGSGGRGGFLLIRRRVHVMDGEVEEKKASEVGIGL
ncbi:unnamed protein product [Caenorhabditis nigoni]